MPIEKHCKCGKTFFAKPSGVKFCSKECGYTYRDTSKMGIKKGALNNGGWKKGNTPWNKEGYGKKRHSTIIKKKWEAGKYKERDFTAEKNPNYKHGEFSVPEYHYVIEERGSICELCESTEQIIVHHKDRDRKNNDRENLQVLCQPCHMVIHCHGEQKAIERARRILCVS